jgi:hypothetical protein
VSVQMEVVDKRLYVEAIASLAELLNYIEHSEANRGQLTTGDKWQENVRLFRERCSRLSIGRTAVDEASADLARARKIIERAAKC